MTNCNSLNLVPARMSSELTNYDDVSEQEDLSLFDLYDTDHSVRRIGHLIVDDTRVIFGQEDPHDGSEIAYYFVTGFTASHESMAMAQCVAAQKSHPAYALAASHNSSVDVLNEGAKELMSVVNATEIGSRKRIIGLSMGGAMAVLASEGCRDVECITLVAPGCMVDAQKRNLPRSIADNILNAHKSRVHDTLADPVESFRNLLVEASTVMRKPLALPRVVVQGFAHSIHRFRALRTEFEELTDPAIHDKVQGSLRQLAERAVHGEVALRVVVPVRDLIVNPKVLAQTARELGVTEVVLYRGPFAGHTGGTIHPAQTNYILALDRHDLAA